MVTVAEKAPARTRFERRRQALEERRAALAAARAEAEALQAREVEAVRELLASKPGARAYTRGEPPFELRAKRERIESSFRGLEVEVAELERLVAEDTAAAAQELVAERVEEIRGLVAASDAAWERFGMAYAALFAAWQDVVEAVERADGAATELLEEELVALAPEVRRDVEQAARLPVVPMPTGFAVAVDVLGRVAFSIDARKQPVNARLAELVPDLRGLARSPRLSRRVDTISTTAQPQVERRA